MIDPLVAIRVLGQDTFVFFVMQPMQLVKVIWEQFRIDRSRDETRNLAHYILFNMDKLSDKDLSKVAQGVSHLPVSHCDPLDKILDATHADINIRIFFKKLIIRIEADLDQWDATQAVSEKLRNIEHKFDIYFKLFIGINPQLMMPGNYARMLFNKGKFVSDFNMDENKCDQLRQIFNK